MIPKTANEAKYAAMGGVVAGIAAGLVLTATMTFVSAISGNDVWFGMKGAAAPLLGEAAMRPGFDFVPVMVGLACHSFVSMLWGVGFGLLFDGLDRRTTIAAGAAWGLVSWAVMMYGVLPAVGLSEMTAQAPVLRSIFFHVFFGLSLSIAYLAFEIGEPRTQVLPRLRPVAPAH